MFAFIYVLCPNNVVLKNLGHCWCYF